MNSNQTSLPLADILVVDDTPDNLRLLSTMLNKQGYKVRKVMNGALALRVASQVPPDLILLDIDMPQMNGYEVCKQLKANPEMAEIPVIFLSALDDASNKVKAFSVGGVDYITKPFQVSEVLARVENQLRMKTLSKQLFQQNTQLQQEIKERQQAEAALIESAFKLRKQNQILMKIARNSALNQGNLKVALREITEATAHNLEVERVSVWLFDSTTTKLQCLDLFEPHLNQHSTGIELPIADYPVYFNALLENQAIVVEEALTDSRTQELSKAYWVPLNISSTIDEPIRLGGKTVGVLCIEQVGERHHWTPEDQNFARSIADLVSLALEARERHRAEAREREKSLALELTLEELKRTQTQLIQIEKMSSLGQIVAGVAHEINNPVSFIYGNLAPARQYFKDLIQLIKIYQKNYPEPIREVEQLVSEIDLNFLIGDWNDLMNSMQVGAERIQEIVRSLQIFSRQTKSELKAVDIHEGIDNMLLILQHRLGAETDRGGIEIIKNYSELPKVTCYVSQLNQVFMNILNNAIDALENQPSPRIITICTKVIANEIANSLPKFVSISIADNGLGMDKDIQAKIFDPFYTTKPVGSGTGLGLSISYEIVVEKHQGKLDYVSAPGQGTECIVEIPVKL
jgi:two-component system, NtrC family, sensor kinase